MSKYDDISPNKSMFWMSVKWLVFAVALLAVFYLFILPLFVGGKLIGRESQKFDAETSAQVYDNSRQYQQGINRDIARYCRDWRDAPDAGKTAVRDLIASTLDTYQGPLSPANEKCVMEIGL